MIAEDRLRAIAIQVQEGKIVTATVSDLLSLFGFKHRSDLNIYYVRRALNELELTTSPNFESARLADNLIFVPVDPRAAKKSLRLEQTRISRRLEELEKERLLLLRQVRQIDAALDMGGRRIDSHPR